MAKFAYEGFIIETFDVENAKWRARISRPNGAAIRWTLDGKVLNVCETEPPQYTEDAAVQLAQQIIDGGGIT